METLDELLLMINELPQNRPMYRDSGCWEIRSEDLQETFYSQGVNESFYQFIKRAFDKENQFMDALL